MLKKIKRVFVGSLIIILLFFLVGVFFLYTSPQFGGKITEHKKEEYSRFSNYKDGKFELTVPVSTSESTWKSVKKMFRSEENQKPSKPIVSHKIDSISLVDNKGKTTRLIWLGHSTFLIQVEGFNILLDPMFSDYPAPLPIPSMKRFVIGSPIELSKLPYIDVVIFSHDHYDHLDYESVLQLKDKVGAFYVPLGLSAHLISWGVKENVIQELNWWEEVNFKNLKLICTPAQHFSGRGLFDQANTLWASWIIQSKTKNIFFSGDSGYGKHFKKIGERYGPFDITLMECGQYDKDWSKIHMFPEQTAVAAKDLNSKLMVPIHWGSFKLSNHSWYDSVERVLIKSKALNIKVAIPEIGELILLDEPFIQKNWWSDYK